MCRYLFGFLLRGSTRFCSFTCFAFSGGALLGSLLCLLLGYNFRFDFHSGGAFGFGALYGKTSSILLSVRKRLGGLDGHPHTFAFLGNGLQRGLHFCVLRSG